MGYGKERQNMAKKAELLIEKDLKIADIDERIYGSFIEHLGRAVYNGIYQPGHKEADEDGFRRDVLDLVKELGVPIVRYPGGNYVSNFFWEDSVGPAADRKARLDLAWRTVESNKFGIGEFVKWCGKAGAEPMMAVNLGTRTTADALNLLEYCNLDTGTYYADMRRRHGDVKPYGIKTWCMGNEMDGPWQTGHMPAYEYGRLAAETAKAMKYMDDSLEFVLCGSSGVDMPTFPEWERIALTEAYDYVDYISLHQYYGNEADDTADFLAKTLDLEHFIHTVICACDYVQAVKRGSRRINLSFDEWNVWYHSKAADEEKMSRHPWDEHPHLLEDHYTFEDALLAGLMLITFLRHADRIRIACLAQLVNVIAPIMTEDDGGAWRQTIFYPFLHTSRYGRGTAMHGILNSERHDTSSHCDVTDADAAVVYNEEKGEVAVFAVNRNVSEDVDFTVKLGGFERLQVREHIVMESRNMKAVNSAEKETVKPVSSAQHSISDGVLRTRLASCSWNVIVMTEKDG